MNKEQLQTVKETSICDEKELQWKRVDIGGENSIRKALQALCSVCNTQYIKDAPEESTQEEPTVVDLEKI